MLSDGERQAFEQRLRAALGQAWAGFGPQLVTALGDPPDATRIPAALWQRLATAVQNAVEPVLVEMTLRSAVNLAAQQRASGAVNWAGMNERAVAWAAGYAFDLVGGITDTTAVRLQQLVTAYFASPEQDLKTLAAKVSEMFGPTRGELIATTEVTRAAASGEDLLTRDIRALNPRVGVVQIWLTSNDEIVCPVCGPLHGVRANSNGLFVSPKGGTFTGPPAHPRCRCAVGTELLDLEPTHA